MMLYYTSEMCVQCKFRLQCFVYIYLSQLKAFCHDTITTLTHTHNIYVYIPPLLHAMLFLLRSSVCVALYLPTQHWNKEVKNKYPKSVYPSIMSIYDSLN